MIIRYFLIAIAFVLFSSGQSHSQLVLNGDFERLDAANKKPIGWTLSSSVPMAKSYAVGVDSVMKQSGKYSLSITKVSAGVPMGVFDFGLAKVFEGKKIELRGYVRTKAIDSLSYAGLWMRIDDQDGRMMVRNMQYHRISGDTDWKQYSIELPYNSEMKVIHFGGLLFGGGTAWFDSMQLFIDGVSIEQVQQVMPKKAALDTAFSKKSDIIVGEVSPQLVNNLTIAGHFWGFLKYHHPAVASGEYNWDAELFRFLPSIMLAKNNVQLSAALEKYLQTLPIPPLCKTCGISNLAQVVEADYGPLFNGTVLSPSLTKRLVFIRENRVKGEQYWFSKTPVGQAIFRNERSYTDMQYPDAGYRLLSLYRYWAMINYFFPSRELMDQKWNTVLKEFIPVFLSAAARRAYLLASVKLIAKIDDTHAQNYLTPVLDQLKGSFAAPFQAKFIEGKLVVTGFYADSVRVAGKIMIGDVLLTIGGRKISDLIKENLPLVPASNLERKMHDLPTYLLRNATGKFIAGVEREGKDFIYQAKMIDYRLTARNLEPTNQGGHYLIKGDIGYLYPAKYKNSELDAIKKEFAFTKGIIVDMRCYPSEPLSYTFGNFIKANAGPFLKATVPDLQLPGSFIYTNTGKEINGGDGSYKGLVIVIVDPSTISQAEFTTMAFQSSSNVKVIGTRSAGADGDLVRITLPGGVQTAISGIGIYYPDGAPSQRSGVKIDELVKPTIAGVTAGRDEPLERAIELIRKGN